MSHQSGTLALRPAFRNWFAPNAQTQALCVEILRLQQQLGNLRTKLDDGVVSQLRATHQLQELTALQALRGLGTSQRDTDGPGHLNQRDPLTDMPNRALMLDRLQSAIALSQRHGTRIAILFVDLDRFKIINDSMGHAAGDKVLKLAAWRIESAVRDSDAVSRHGGDEFLVLLNEVNQASDAALIATKMLLNLTMPCLVNQQKVQISASIGISICPDHHQEAAALIDLADAAMYSSKRRGGGSYSFHEPVGSG